MFGAIGLIRFAVTAAAAVTAQTISFKLRITKKANNVQCAFDKKMLCRFGQKTAYDVTSHKAWGRLYSRGFKKPRLKVASG